MLTLVHCMHRSKLFITYGDESSPLKSRYKTRDHGKDLCALHSYTQSSFHCHSCLPPLICLLALASCHLENVVWMESHIIWPFVSYNVSQIVHIFLLLNSVLRKTIICSTIYLLKGLLVTSSFEPLQMKLLWTFMDRCLCAHQCFCGVNAQGCNCWLLWLLYVWFLRNCKQFSRVAIAFDIPNRESVFFITLPALVL